MNRETPPYHSIWRRFLRAIGIWLDTILRVGLLGRDGVNV